MKTSQVFLPLALAAVSTLNVSGDVTVSWENKWASDKKCNQIETTFTGIHSSSSCMEKCEEHAQHNNYDGDFCCAYSKNKKKCQMSPEGRAGGTNYNDWKKRDGTASSQSDNVFTASTTAYFYGDSAQTLASPRGACGGAYLDEIRILLNEIKNQLDYDYFPVALSEQMMENIDDSCGVPVSSNAFASYSNVLHAYCGQCIEFTSDAGVTVGGLVLDLCPEDETNSAHCRSGGKANDKGYYNHLDFFGVSSSGSDVTSIIGDNPSGTIKIVPCPDVLDNNIKSFAAASKQESESPVCSWYYDIGKGKWQGAYGHAKWGCSECGSSSLVQLRSSVANRLKKKY